MVHHRGHRAVAGLGLCAALLAGCGLDRPSATLATKTAQEFYQAVSAQDGSRACALLAPATIERLEDDSGEPCAEAIVEGEVGRVLSARAEEPSGPDAKVAGRQAQVVLAADVLFLTISGDRWLITAAGCDARPDRPYDCVLEGS